MDQGTEELSVGTASAVGKGEEFGKSLGSMCFSFCFPIPHAHG